MQAKTIDDRVTAAFDSTKSEIAEKSTAITGPR
jgi:hypothetical protein